LKLLKLALARKPNHVDKKELSNIERKEKNYNNNCLLQNQKEY
jgi:hypothetical protein